MPGGSQPYTAPQPHDEHAPRSGDSPAAVATRLRAMMLPIDDMLLPALGLPALPAAAGGGAPPRSWRPPPRPQ